MKYAVGVLVAVAMLAMAGCGSPTPAAAPLAAPLRSTAAAESSSAAVSESAAFQATDVMFLQMMVTQERETAELIAMAKGRALSAGTKNLTAAIRATQADEAEGMVDWLRERQQPTTADPDPAAHTHHGAATELTEADRRGLRRSRGAEFERGLLNLLLAQQHNAIELARMTADAGGDPWVKEVAQQVDRTRTAEVAEMLRMVAAIPAT